MTRRKLPIGMQTFRKIREGRCYYVDKTAYIQQLLDKGEHYFLSRPRRFGKSLFLDTCKELFEGNEPLFEGLAIHDRWDWSVRHPVLRLSFGSGNFTEPGQLALNLKEQLAAAERRAGVVTDCDTAPGRLSALLEALHRQAGQTVAVLVDEYDKPILDALDAPEVARANRDFLRGLYAVVKDCDAHIRFSFITGVSKFSKVSLFSGLNNLTDITLEPDYSAICGYTEADLDTVFAPELGGLDRDQVRDWYNGYSWRGEEKVYNPFDILLLFRKREFAAHWFETGTPTFLVDTLFRRRVSSLALDGMVSNAELLSTFDVDDMPTEALLFQTGYLTIERPEPRGAEIFYRLGYPNLEVRQSLNRSLPEPHDGGRIAVGGAQCAALRPAAGQRLHGSRGAVRVVLRQHSVRVVHEQRHRELRGLLRQRVLLVLRGAGAGRGGGGQQQPRPPGHGGALQRQRLPVRVQGGGAGARGRGARAVEGARLRGQVPRSGRADPLDRGGVQQGGPQPGGVRRRAGLTRRSESHDAPTCSSSSSRSWTTSLLAIRWIPMGRSPSTGTTAPLTNGDGAVDFVEVEIFEGPDGVIHTGDDFGRFVTLLNTTPTRSPRCVR